MNIKWMTLKNDNFVSRVGLYLIVYAFILVFIKFIMFNIVN